MAKQIKKNCQICEQPFRARRDAKTCSPACRKRLQRHLATTANSLANEARKLGDKAATGLQNFVDSLLPRYVSLTPALAFAEAGGAEPWMERSDREEAPDRRASVTPIAIEQPESQAVRLDATVVPPSSVAAPPTATQLDYQINDEEPFLSSAVPGSVVGPTDGGKIKASSSGSQPALMPEPDDSSDSNWRRLRWALLLVLLLLGCGLLISLACGRNNHNRLGQLDSQQQSQASQLSHRQTALDRRIGRLELRVTALENKVNGLKVGSITTSGGSSSAVVQSAANATLAGNTFNGPNELVQLTSTGLLPALNGSKLTNVDATTLQGNGPSYFTNASNLSSGTLSDSRLSSNVALLNANNTFTGANVFGSTVAIQGSGGLTLGVPGSVAGNLYFANASGSGQVILQGLNPGGVGNATVQIPSIAGGTTDTVCLMSLANCGTGGSAVTSLDGQTGALTLANSTGVAGTITINSAKADGSTKGIAAFNATNFTDNGSGVINTVQNIATGSSPTFNTLTLSGGTLNGQTISSSANFTGTLNVSGLLTASGGIITGGANINAGSGTITGNGSGLTNLNASNLSNGTVADARLSGNVALLNGTGPQIFTGNNKFTGTVLVQPAADSTTDFQIQNAAGTSNLLVADTTNTRLGIGTASPATTLSVYNPNSSLTQTNFTQSLTNGGIDIATNYVDGAYTPGLFFSTGDNNPTKPKAGIYLQETGVGTNLLFGTSNNYTTGITNTALTIDPSGAAVFQNGTDTAFGFTVKNSGGTGLLTVNTSANLVAAQQLEVNTLGANGTSVLCYNALQQVSSCNGTAGSGNYIFNGTTTQTANFNIQSAAIGNVAAVVQGASGQTADLLDLRNGGGSIVASVGSTGNTLIQPSTNSTTAFQIQNAAGTSNLFVADTTNGRIGIGTITPNFGFDVEQNVGLSNGQHGLLWVSEAPSTSVPGLFGGYVANGTTVTGAFIREGGQSGTLDIGTAGSQQALHITNGGAATFQNGSNSTTAFQIQNQAGTSNLFVADTTDSQIGIGAAPANGLLTVGTNTTAASGGLYFGTDTNLYRSAASTLKTDNGLQVAGVLKTGGLGGNGQFNVQPNATGTIGIVARGASGQTGDLEQFQDSSANILSGFDSSGQLYLGRASALTGTVKLYNASGSGSIGLTTANPGSSTFTLTLPAETGTLCSTGSVCSGYAAASGSGNYIQNGTTTQTANFNVESAAIGSVAAVIQGATGQTADLLDIKDGSGSPVTVLSVTKAGVTTIKTSTNNTAAFQVQGSTTAVTLDVDTTNQRIGIGTGNPTQALSLSSGSNIAMFLPNSITPTLTPGSSGSLATNTYFYKITALDGAAGETNFSLAVESSVAVTGPNGSVQLNWTAVTGAASYRIYRGISAGGENVFYTSTTNSFTDTGAAGTAGSGQNQVTGYVDKVNGAGNSWFNGGNVGIGTATPSALLQVQTPTNTTTAFNVQNASSISALNVDTTNLTTTVRGGTDTATLGSNLITCTDFTNVNAPCTGSQWTTTGWTAATTTATHNTGNTSALSTSEVVPVNGTVYEVSYTVNGTPTTGSTLTVTLGGVTVGSYTMATSGPAFTETKIITATNGNLLTFTPSSSFNGIVSSVSIQQLTTNPNPTLAVKNASGTVNIEVRASSSTTNTFVGLSSGQSNSSGIQNTAFGTQALQNNTTGNNNSALGYHALLLNVGGSQNSSFGNGTLAANTGGNNNTAVGNGALGANTVGNNNTAVGNSALSVSTAGINNTALGVSALAANTTGSNSVAVGNSALAANTTNNNSVAVGSQSLVSATGGGNVAVGFQAGRTNTSGNATTTGINNTFLGVNSGPGQNAYQVSSAGAIGSTSIVNQSNAIILGCTNGLNNCAATTTVGIGSQYAPNALTVSPSTYGTNGTTDTGTTISQTGTAITGAGTTFTSAMTGGTIYYNDGTTATVTFVNTTTLTSSVSKTVSASSTYTIVYGGFNVTANGTAILQPSGSSDILDLQQSGVNVVQVTSTGATLFKNSVNSTTAFQILDSSNTNLLTADTTTDTLTVDNLTVTGVCTGCGSVGTVSLQSAYTAGATINTTDNKSIAFTLADTTTDSNFTVNSACTPGSTCSAGGGQFQVQSAGTGVFTVAAGGAVTSQNSTNSSSAFLIQNAAGSNSSDNLLSLSTVANANNLIASNPSFEQNTTGWAAKGNMAISRVTNQSPPFGTAAMQITNSGTPAALNGAKFLVNMSNATTYNLSFYAKSAAAFATMTEGWSNDGTNDLTTGCSLVLTTSTTNWNRFNCTFTTGTTTPGSSYIFIGQNDATSRTWYVDGISLEAVASGTFYKEGTLNLNGLALGNTLIQPATNSTEALRVASVAGVTGLQVDTNGSTLVTNFGTTINSTALVNIASATAFQVRNSTTLAQVIRGDTTIVNLDTNNGSVENGTTGYSVHGTSPTLTADSTANNAYTGGNTLKVVTTSAATANAGPKYNLTTGTFPAATYTLSFFAKVPAGGVFTTLDAGYAADGATDTICTLNSTTVTSTWQRYICTFTDVTTPSGTPYFFIGQSDAGVAHTYFLDGIQLETAAAANNYREGKIQLNGDIISPTIFHPQSDSSLALQVENAAGGQLINVNTTPDTANLITNGSFEVGTTGWAGKNGSGTSTISNTYVAGQQYIGQEGLQVATTGGNSTNAGTTYNITLANSTQYTLTFYAKLNSGSMTDLQAGYSSTGVLGGESNCTLNSTTLVTTSWQRYTCTFTTPGSNSGTPYVYISQSGSTNHTYFLDAVKLEQAATATPYQEAAISLNAALIQPATFKNQNDSTNAFQIQNAAGTSNLFVADTANSLIGIGLTPAAGGAALQVSGAISATTTITAATLNGTTGINTGAGSGTQRIDASGNIVNAGNFTATAGSTFSTTGANGFTFKPGSDNTTAFQVQNAAGTGTLLQIDTTNSNITVGGNNSAALQAWTTTTVIPANTQGTQVTANGYVYILGGDGDAASTTVRYARLNANGTIPAAGQPGTWGTTTAMPQAIEFEQAVSLNGYIYTLGGGLASGKTSNVYYAKENPDGTLGSWTATTSLPPANGISSGGSATYNGYIYMIGGYTDPGNSINNTVYYAKANPDGTVGAWNTTTVLLGNREGTGVAVANGYLYVVGGYSGSFQNTVYYAKLNSNGTVGAWTSNTNQPLTVTGEGTAATVLNGYLYVVGGHNNSGRITDTGYAALNADGSVGTWSSGPVLAAPNGPNDVLTVNGYIYVLGGEGNSGLATAQYTTSPRLQIGGSVDLIGLGGENLAEGDSGGTLTAGDTTIVGTLTVQNQATFAGGASTGGSLSVAGSAAFRNTANSTTAFQVQNASGTSIFNVDTANNRVGINNSAPGNLLSIGALTTAAGTYQVAVSTGGTTNSGIVVQDVAGQSSGNILQAQDSTGAALATIDYLGNLTVKAATINGTLTINGHVITGNTTGSTTAAVNANAGSGGSPACSVSGNDTGGQVTLTTGTSAWASGTQCTITFASAFGSAPHPVMSNATNVSTAAVGVYVNSSTTTFTINFMNADTAQHTYIWNYFNAQ